MPREERERRYVSDYALQFLPAGTWQINVPLGPIPDDILTRHGPAAGAALFRPSRPRIDLVHWTNDTYWLIECKVREPKQAIGDIVYYRTLIPSTLDLPNWTGQDFGMRIVFPWALDAIITAAKGLNIDVVIYLPPWVEAYVRERQNYFTRDYRTARDEKMRLRKTFGLE